ncbi:mechanosensitive ion channel [Alkalibacterium olivapovliticus]|uniref:Putative transporter (Transmembrane protein) n=1 Tax=Alkalibacterium olivapovliticus TaxID=99907 RepID=A0A2T0W7S0_9LACT|nr:mechanosensitive ion channel [Alkalibacterium olivapovliticus]PRY82757.1 putative transporter (transmembrane protein) [Alkalibacterium olivapovliticus]
MNNIGDSFQRGLNTFVDFLPRLLMGIVLIIVAWLVATLVMKAITKGLKAAGGASRLQKWGAANTEEQGHTMINALGKVGYFLVWVLFLPGIFYTFGLEAIGQPIQNMLDTALSFLPNILSAIVVLVLGFFAAKFVKNLVYNLAVAANLDRFLDKFAGTETDAQEVEKSKGTLASVLANIVYFLILVPIILVALDVLNIDTIAQPVSDVLNTILQAIPNILVAVVLLAIGMVLAKFAGDIITDLLRGTGFNKYSSYLKQSGNVNIDLAKITGQIVSFLIGIFFLVEALNVLNLAMLNTIVAAIILYLPNVLFAAIIIGLAFIGGQVLASGIKSATGSSFAGMTVKYILITFAVFMALDQLNFATTIVNFAFLFIIGGLAVAFALAFGLGGRDFARKQLERADQKIEKESAKPSGSTNDSPEL